MDELKDALREAGLDRVPLADVFGFDADCASDGNCTSGCHDCHPGCNNCSTGATNGGS